MRRAAISALGPKLALAFVLAGAFVPGAQAMVEGPVIHETTEYRDVSGSSQAALIASLDRIAIGESGGRFYGNTHWELRWNFSVASSRGQCRVTAAGTELTVQMTLPRWIPPDRAPRALVERWNAFATALRTHEEGHRDIAIEAARAMQKRVGATPPASDCDVLKRTVGELAHSILDDYRERERRYDETTGHGRTQGAVFP